MINVASDESTISNLKERLYLEENFGFVKASFRSLDLSKGDGALYVENENRLVSVLVYCVIDGNLIQELSEIHSAGEQILLHEKGVASQSDLVSEDFYLPRETPFIYLNAIDSAISGQGSGSSLVTALKEKYPSLSINTTAFSQGARTFFEKQGFKDSGLRTSSHPYLKNLLAMSPEAPNNYFNFRNKELEIGTSFEELSDAAKIAGNFLRSSYTIMTYRPK